MRRYIDGNEVKISLNDDIFVDVEFYTGEKYTMLEAKCLFPFSGRTRYISLLDEQGNDIATIRNVDDLLPESKEAIMKCIDERYRIPKITRFIKRTDYFQIWLWTVDTDKGRYTFEIINAPHSIKTLYDGRILIKDGNDNRYEIPDFNKLDKRSQKMLAPDL